MKTLMDSVIDSLKVDERFVIDGKLAKNKIVESALNLDPALLKLLLNNEQLKKHFFIEVEGILIFDKVAFQRFVNNKSFLPDSFTQFKNKIGLTVDNHYLLESNDVALSWPYKDCVLEGGQTKDDQKRSEVFWNETLAPEQVDTLLLPKALSHFSKHDQNGKHTDFELDGNENYLIKGNNLLALHSLHRVFNNSIKLIYIDPPYNTGSDSFNYNDNFSHSTWLTFMKNRLEIAIELLKDDGVLFVQVDDNEQAYLKVLLDEVFGRENFINTLSVNLKNVAGASGGGEDKRLKKNIEYIHIYAKDYTQLEPFKGIYEYIPVDELVEMYKETGTSWKYISVLVNDGEKIYVGSTVDGSGNEIKIFKREGFDIKSIAQVIKSEGITEKEAYLKYASRLFQTQMPQSSIRPRVKDKVKELGIDNELFSIEYEPRSGRNKGAIYEQFYKGNNFRLLAWLSDVCEEIDGVLYKKEKQGTYWNYVKETKNLSKEGGVDLLAGKKPERLIGRIIEMATECNDIVLDYHLGSGTTAAVAHKLGRRYIGVEQLDYQENSPIVRLKNVVHGDNTAFSKDVNWQGGGSFVYCELAELASLYSDRIEKAQSSDELINIWNELKESSNLSYKVDTKKFDKNITSFNALSFEDQQRFLIEAVDKNQLYVNYSDIDDETNDISEQDKKMNQQFYGA
ncbi:DNA methyltransferase [Yersinia ruckeri]|uniref:DNA methyltransferase n=1 Tax=Yersinia ruckeri TaxID=29486 RepID=UPI0020BEA5FF|nr:site-specific DNA-methyltransferase [Yersinia ruckeri]MCW6538949.1 site-specific DNA-methyltransferase [Yersinia ruckeri]UZY11156.1 site-specific DNA-methyltransferase [Yersinia ruckeri]